MGAPSQTVIQSLSDGVAARLQSILSGITAAASGLSNSPLWDVIDASGDPDVENALGSYALALDRSALPEDYADAVEFALSRAEDARLITALSDLVAAAGYADFEAYLTDKSATVHPLFAELTRKVLGESVFTESSDVTTVFAPGYACIAAARAYTGADGSLTDDTTDAGDADTADVALFASDDHTLYIGSPHKFDRVVIALSTVASATIEPTIQYWNGSAWATLSATDNTAGLTRNDVITFTAPSDWSRCNTDAGGTAFGDKARLYYIRIARTADSLVTPPVATCIRVSPASVVNASGTHLGVAQPPLALVRVTAADTVSVDAVAGVDYTRFAEPGVSLRALTPISQNLTVTLSYVDQTGTDATKAQTAWTAPAALGTKSCTLNTGDTGVRSIRSTGFAVSTNATEGVFEVYVAESRTPAL